MVDSAFNLLVDDETQAQNNASSRRKLTAPQRSADSTPHIANDPKGFFTDPRNIMSALTGLAVATAPRGAGSSTFNQNLLGGLAGLGTRGNIENKLEDDRGVERQQLVSEQNSINSQNAENRRADAAENSAAFDHAQYMGNMWHNAREAEKNDANRLAVARSAAAADDPNQLSFPDWLKYVQASGEYGQQLPPLDELRATWAAGNANAANPNYIPALKNDGSGNYVYTERVLVDDPAPGAPDDPNAPDGRNYDDIDKQRASTPNTFPGLSGIVDQAVTGLVGEGDSSKGIQSTRGRNAGNTKSSDASVKLHSAEFANADQVTLRKWAKENLQSLSRSDKEFYKRLVLKAPKKSDESKAALRDARRNR